MDQNENDVGSEKQLVSAPVQRGFYASVDVPAPTSLDEIMERDGSAKWPWRDLYPAPAMEAATEIDDRYEHAKPDMVGEGKLNGLAPDRDCS